MSNHLKTNKRGLVVVKLLKNYASNVAGETCAFLPEIARALIAKGAAVVPGAARGECVEGDDDAPAITTRQFHPLDHDKDGKKGGSLPSGQRDELADLQAEFVALTGQEPDKRWGRARLEAEIAKARDAAVSDAGEPEGEGDDDDAAAYDEAGADA